VFGGTFFAVMYTAPLPVFLGSFGAMAKAFLPPVKKPDAMIERMIELAAVARKDGMMALEGQEVPDKFFEKGLQMLVDGADERTLVRQMTQEIKGDEAPTRSQSRRCQGLDRYRPGDGHDRYARWVWC
jgi:chemotaxis protein MotA